MKTINYKYRINQGWNNYPAEVKITVDDKLYDLLSIIQGNMSLSEKPKGDFIYFHKTGVMSKDKGFGWVNLSARQHGQDIGMFYGGIPKGAQFVALSLIRGAGEYHYEELLRTA